MGRCIYCVRVACFARLRRCRLGKAGRYLWRWGGRGSANRGCGQFNLDALGASKLVGLGENQGSAMRPRAAREDVDARLSIRL